jgi:hypothetical protein
LGTSLEVGEVAREVKDVVLKLQGFGVKESDTPNGLAKMGAGTSGELRSGAKSVEEVGGVRRQEGRGNARNRSENLVFGRYCVWTLNV